MCPRAGGAGSLLAHAPDELVDDAEVLAGQAVDHHRPVDLMRQRAQRDRRVGARGGGLRQAQVLRDQASAEATLQG